MSPPAPRLPPPLVEAMEYAPPLSLHAPPIKASKSTTALDPPHPQSDTKSMHVTLPYSPRGHYAPPPSPMTATPHFIPPIQVIVNIYTFRFS